MNGTILSLLFGVSLLSGALAAPLSDMFEGRNLFEFIMGEYRYRKDDGWAHTGDIAENFKGVDFYRDFVEINNVITVKTAVSMKTTIVMDVNAWLNSKPIQDNIKFLKEGLGENIKSNGKRMKILETAKIDIYMPRENITSELLNSWSDKLLDVTKSTGIEFEIHSLEKFIK